MPFYTQIEPDPALARGYVYMLDAIDAYVARGRLGEAAHARRILRRMWREYEELGVQGAVKADEFIRGRLHATAVRPPTSGRLAAAISSRPIPSTFPAGAIGIADLARLEKGAINPRAKKAGSYWRAQEYGTDAHVGRIVPGYFFPPQSAPNAAEFRDHPYFQQAKMNKAGSTRRGMPAMVIGRPLDARHFLRDGTDEAVAWHRLESARINRRAISSLAAI